MWAPITMFTFIDKGTERLSDLPKVTHLEKKKKKQKRRGKNGRKCSKSTQIVESKIVEMNAMYL